MYKIKAILLTKVSTSSSPEQAAFTLICLLGAANTCSKYVDALPAFTEPKESCRGSRLFFSLAPFFSGGGGGDYVFQRVKDEPEE